LGGVFSSADADTVSVSPHRAGGVPHLFAKIPVGAFIDHGANREPGDRETEQSWEAYQKTKAVRRSILPAPLSPTLRDRMGATI
jgi:hypothetical protein